MNDQYKLEVITDMIRTTYEAMGMAVVDIRQVAAASFLVDVIDADGPKEVLVNIFLQMVNIHAH